MRRAVLSLQRCEQGSRTKKPSESQKAKAFWAMKAAKDRREEYDDPARKDYVWEGNTQDWSRGKSTPKDPIAALDKALKCVGSKFVRKVMRTAMACSWVGLGILQIYVGEGPFWECVWLYLDPVGPVERAPWTKL